MKTLICTALVLLSLSCGGIQHEHITSTSQADTIAFPSPPSHIMQPGQYWPYICGNYSYCYDSNGVYLLGNSPNRCPCITEPPPGCRMPPNGTAATRLGI